MCFNPHRLLYKSVYYKGVEKKIIFWKTTVDEYNSGSVTVSDFSRLSPSFLLKNIKYGLKLPITFDNRIELPCRKCLECTKARASAWSVRCELEALQYEHNYFVTLTYNDLHVPLKCHTFFDTESDGCFVGSAMSLCKAHTSQFMKRLRSYYKDHFDHDNIRFFCAGEYGSSTARPHYHFILFNLPLYDLYPFGKSHNGFPMFRSPALEKVWPYGFVYVQEYSIETARYVAQYCCKKLNTKFYPFVEPEFINMSRMPGIGSSWFYKNCDHILSVRDYDDLGFMYFNDSIYLSHFNLKSKMYESVSFKVPAAFFRYFIPETNTRLNIDTEFRSDIAFVLNDQGWFLKDAYYLLSLSNRLRSEASISCDLSDYGFSPGDRYNYRYDEFLSLKRRILENSFTVKRDLS